MLPIAWLDAEETDRSHKKVCYNIEKKPSGRTTAGLDGCL